MDMNNKIHSIINSFDEYSRYILLVDLFGEAGMNVLNIDSNITDHVFVNSIFDSIDFSLIDDIKLISKIIDTISSDDLIDVFDTSVKKDILKKYRKTEKNIENSSVFTSKMESSDNRFYDLLDYQFIVKSRALASLYSPYKRNFIIHMPTGSGKTKTTMHILIDFIIKYRNADSKFLWVVHSKELALQAFDTLKKSWNSLGVGSLNCYVSTFDKDNPIISNGIIIITYQKLSRMFENSNREFMKTFINTLLIVCDEAHHSAADKWKKPLIELHENGARIIGLTATPGRGTNDDPNVYQLRAVYDDIISIDMETAYRITMSKEKFERKFNLDYIFEPICELQKRGILSKIIREEIFIDNYEASVLNEINQSSNEETTLKILSENPLRNYKIINKLVDVYKKHKQIIVFACNNRHAYLLQKLLMFKNIESGVITTTTTNSKREKLIFDFKSNKLNVLINNKVLTTGFDAPNIECVFITRATRSVITYSQMIGRGLRGVKMGGNEFCLLVDIVDNISIYKDENAIFKYFNNYWS